MDYKKDPFVSPKEMAKRFVRKPPMAFKKTGKIADMTRLLTTGEKPPFKKMKEGGAAFPDLTGDGKVTRADILKGRGVKGFKGGGCVMRGRGGSYKGTN